MNPDDALDAYPPPRDLGDSGRGLWAHLTEAYSWRYDELVMVERACRLVDVINRREREVAELGTLEATDHRGAPVDHPVAAGLARDLNALRLVMASLGIAGSTSTSTRTSSQARSVAARSAANTRWRTG
ncbi:hypothetical protein ACFPK1_18910 [Actinomycetospora rhizophila]|uniref:Phage terminase small subunit n=1 Tax=Actinomycetospora rhizophila TaxID=1416876 RepID=A0ABV9ZFJ3_9PSEU